MFLIRYTFSGNFGGELEGRGVGLAVSNSIASFYQGRLELSGVVQDARREIWRPRGINRGFRPSLWRKPGFDLPRLKLDLQEHLPRPPLRLGAPGGLCHRIEAGLGKFDAFG